jgi:uncharacterized membrane protein YvbJ
MGFCSKCGKSLAEDAYFCPKCGARTVLGVEAGVVAPSDELRETFNKMGQEMEKAFTHAAKEIEKAFETARKNIQESTGRAPIICSLCGEKNRFDSHFCYKCGKELAKS